MSESPKKPLEQGRGAGFLAALEAGGGASADVLDCVLNDPRWDRQVEEREEYYAQLLLHIEADIDVLGRRVVHAGDEAEESDLWLPIGVLAQMSRRGAKSARYALSEAIRQGAGWRACLDALDAAGGADLVDQVVDVQVMRALIARVGIDEIADAVALVAAPWKRWVEQVPALRFVVEGGGSPRSARGMSGPVAWAVSRIRKPELPSNLGAASTESLLGEASTPGAASKLSEELARRTDANTLRLLVTAADLGTPDERYVALRALGEQGSTEFVAAAEEFLRRESALPQAERHEHRVRQGYLRYLEQLSPARTLPLARAWFCESWPLSLAAERILARHATADDRPMLETAGADALEAAEMYRLCSIVDAISAAGPEFSLPFLSDVYEHAPYSYARRRVVSAMRRCSFVDATKPYLREALWDCEPESRELACRSMDGSTGCPLARIEEMARDSFEDTDVRNAARAALHEP